MEGEHVYKKITVVGSSDKGVDAAIGVAVEKAGKSLHGMSWFEVKEIRGSVKDGKAQAYQVVLDIGFKLD